MNHHHHSTGSRGASGERTKKLWFNALDAAMRARNLETQAAGYCLQAQDGDLDAARCTSAVSPEGALGKLRRAVLDRVAQLQMILLGALDAGREAPPLIAQHDPCPVPSVTMWFRWLERLAPAADRPSIVFADPELMRENRPEALERLWLLGADALSGSLPFARIDGRMILRCLGSEDFYEHRGDAGDEASAAISRGLGP